MMAIKEKPRLVVFDVEGVLTPKNMFFFQVGRKLGFFALIHILLYRFLYEVGICSLDTSLKCIFRKIEGQKMETLQEVFDKIPATSRLQNFFAQIKESGNCIVLFSSSLPTVIVKRFAACLDANYAYGVDVCVNAAGEVTGEISGGPIKTNGRLKILQKILVTEDLSLHDCTVIAKDRCNRCLFTLETEKIGYNPNFIIRIKSNHVVMGKLESTLPILKGEKTKRSFPSVNDFIRENIHATGIAIPIIAHIIGILPVAIFIIVLSITYFTSEIARLYNKNLPLISTITRQAASQSELYEFAAAPLFYAIGILFTLLFFPYPVNAVAIATFTIGDSVASIFGGLIGIKMPFNKGKTLEGTLSGFIFAFIASSLFVAPWIAAIGAAVAMFVEYLPIPINDNISIPLITAVVLSLLII
jgi:dolichol kinase/phosphoserine phosphatase